MILIKEKLNTLVSSAQARKVNADKEILQNVKTKIASWVWYLKKETFSESAHIKKYMVQLNTDLDQGQIKIIDRVVASWVSGWQAKKRTTPDSPGLPPFLYCFLQLSKLLPDKSDC